MEPSPELVALISGILLWIAREVLGLRVRRNAPEGEEGEWRSSSGTWAARPTLLEVDERAKRALDLITRHEEICEARYQRIDKKLDTATALLARLDERSTLDRPGHS